MNTEIFKTPAGRLKEAGAREILRRKALFGAENTYQRIAHDLGVSIGTVFNVVKGKTWGWLQ